MLTLHQQIMVSVKVFLQISLGIVKCESILPWKFNDIVNVFQQSSIAMDDLYMYNVCQYLKVFVLFLYRSWSECSNAVNMVPVLVLWDDISVQPCTSISLEHFKTICSTLVYMYVLYIGTCICTVKLLYFSYQFCMIVL